MTKDFSVRFSQCYKVAVTHELPSEDILMNLEKKMRNDTEVLNVAIDNLRDMGDLCRNIFEQELQLNYTLGSIKEQQNLFTTYLVNFNNSVKVAETNKALEEDFEINENWD